MSEQWMPIPDWDGYEVSDHGQVRQGNRTYTVETDTHGYKHVRIRRDGKRTTLRVHRLVLSAFVGEAPESADGCHRNGDRADNRVENLYWGSRSENIRDAVRHGTHYNTRKTHCPKGHEYAADNTYTHTRTRPNGRTATVRECKTCHRIRHGKPDRLRGLVE